MKDFRLTVLVQDYEKALKKKNLTPRTQEHCLRGVHRFIVFLAAHGRHQAQDIRPQDLESFRSWALERLVRSPKARGPMPGFTGLGHWMRAVIRFCRWLVAEEVLLLDPAREVEPIGRLRFLPRILTYQQVEQLLAAAQGPDPLDQRDLAILELFYASGLRRGEMAALDLTDLDLHEGEVFVRHGKGGSSRRVPVGGPALRALGPYLEHARPMLLEGRGHGPPDPEALFITCWGTRFRAVPLGRMVRQRGHKAGLGRVTPHMLRHAAAVHMLQRGANMREIQAFLGHQDLETTVHYTSLVIDDLKAAHTRSHPREEMRI